MKKLTVLPDRARNCATARSCVPGLPYILPSTVATWSAADNQGVRVFVCNGSCLGFREAQGESFRGFAGQGGFICFGVGYCKLQAEPFKEFAAIWRRGRRGLFAGS